MIVQRWHSISTELSPVKRIFLLVLLLFIILVPSSCHTSRKTIKNDTKYSSQPVANTANDWANLNIKLDKDDDPSLFAELKHWLGVPYKYGGNSHNGTDCSGLVHEVYKKIYNIDLERNSAKILENNCSRISLNDIMQGDLLFFKGIKNGKVNHVGIYLRDGYFVHSSSSKGVMVSNINTPYYRNHFYTAGRITTSTRH